MPRGPLHRKTPLLRLGLEYLSSPICPHQKHPWRPTRFHGHQASREPCLLMSIEGRRACQKGSGPEEEEDDQDPC